MGAKSDHAVDTKQNAQDCCTSRQQIKNKKLSLKKFVKDNRLNRFKWQSNKNQWTQKFLPYLSRTGNTNHEFETLWILLNCIGTWFKMKLLNFVKCFNTAFSALTVIIKFALCFFSVYSSAFVPLICQWMKELTPHG